MTLNSLRSVPLRVQILPAFVPKGKVLRYAMPDRSQELCFHDDEDRDRFFARLRRAAQATNSDGLADQHTP